MKVTAATKTTILSGMSKKGMNNTDVANAIGKSRSWVSKLLKEQNEITDLSPEVIDQLNDVLEIDLNPIVYREGAVSKSALLLSKQAEEDIEVAQLIDSLAKLVERPERAYIPYVDQKNLVKIGSELTKVVMTWEEGEDPHYAKIAVESLHFLREFFAKNQ